MQQFKLLKITKCSGSVTFIRSVQEPGDGEGGNAWYQIYHYFLYRSVVCALTIIVVYARYALTGRHALNSRHQTLGGRRAVPTVYDVHI